VVEDGSIEERLFGLAGGAVAALGFALVDVRELAPGGRRVFRFTIDGAEGVNIADCEAVSRELGYLLDAESDLDQNYVLEVSSPGLDHRLRKQREYEHFVGRAARLVRRDVSGQDAVVRGTILGAEDGVVRLRDNEGVEIEIALSDIARGRLSIENLDSEDGGPRAEPDTEEE